MIKKLVLRLAVPLVCLILFSDTPRAEAQIPVSGKQAAGIFAVLIGVGVGVGVGVYYLVRAPRKITGCVVNDGGSLQLSDDKSKSLYLLEGESKGVTPGLRVRVSGKPGKDSKKRKTFFVNKVSGSFGACTTP